MGTRNFDFAAFISYRRKDGARIAKWLRRRIETYNLSTEVIEALRADRDFAALNQKIYLDTAYEKPSDDFLLDKIFPALEGSQDLIVISTPSVGESIVDENGNDSKNWVTREIEHFQSKCQSISIDREIYVILGPGASDQQLPKPLATNENRDFVDLRMFSVWRSMLRSASLDAGIAKLIAGIYRLPEHVLPLLLSEEKRRRRTLWTSVGSAGAAIAGIMIYLSFSLFAEQSAREAVQYQQDYLAAREAIDNGAVAQGVRGLQDLVSQTDRATQDIKLMFESWASRLIPIDEILNSMPGDGIVRWRGQNFVKRGPNLTERFDGPGVLLGAFSSDDHVLITLDTDRVVRLRDRDGLDRSRVEFDTEIFEPTLLSELFDGQLFLLRGVELALTSDEDSEHAQDIGEESVILLDRNSRKAVMLSFPMFEYDCSSLSVTGGLVAQLGLGEFQPWTQVIVNVKLGSDGLTWSADEDPDPHLDRDNWSSNPQCPTLVLSENTSDNLLSVRQIDFPKLRNEADFWQYLTTRKDDEFADVDECSNQDSGLCYLNPCSEDKYRSKNQSVCEVLDFAERAEWISETPRILAFVAITGNQSAAVLMCRLGSGNSLDGCVRNDTTARTAREDFPSEGLVIFNSLEIHSGTLRVYRLPDLSEIELIPQPAEQLADIDVSDDGKTIALLNNQGELWIYARDEGLQARLTSVMAIQSLSGHAAAKTSSRDSLERVNMFDSVDYAGDGSWIVAGREGGIFLVSPAQNKVLWSRPSPPELTGDLMKSVVDRDMGFVYAIGRRSSQAFSLDNGAPLSRVVQGIDLLELLVQRGTLAQISTDEFWGLEPSTESDGSVGLAVRYMDSRYFFSLKQPERVPLEGLPRRTGLIGSGIVDLTDAKHQ